MLRTTSKSVSGPLRRHVYISCLARPGAISQRQFHYLPALRTDLSQSKPETQSVESVEPVDSVDASKKPVQSPKNDKPIGPWMDIVTWNALNQIQRTNYRKRFRDKFNIFQANRRKLAKAKASEEPQTKASEPKEKCMETEKTNFFQQKGPELTTEEAKSNSAINPKTRPPDNNEGDISNIVSAHKHLNFLKSELAKDHASNGSTVSALIKQEAHLLRKLVVKVNRANKTRSKTIKGAPANNSANTPTDNTTEKLADKPADKSVKARPVTTRVYKSHLLKFDSDRYLSSMSENDKPDPIPNQSPSKLAPAPAPAPALAPAPAPAPAPAAKKAVKAGWSPLPRDIVSVHRSTIHADSLKLQPIDAPMPPVPGVSFGLDRVLFNPGVYHLRDPRSGVYNFDPYLDQIMPVTEFDFDSLKPYITSSKDVTASRMAKENKKKYYGSSSSMTSVLSHFHYLLSNWRPIDASQISQGFPESLRTFTRLLRAPAAMFLHYNEKEDVYAIDADKEYDNANILMNLGKSMEKLLTLPKEEFERYGRSSQNKITPEEEETVPESYHFTGLGKFLMRSQLDAYDPRLPGTGMYDLKTRAVVSIRMDATNHERGMGYEIKNRFGTYESFEREYFDMIRAAFLKYSLQVRVGRMDGIFVAFHNIERIFGFQYISLQEMDQSLHGQRNASLGDKEFAISVNMWEKILDKATAKFPEQSLRFHFETRAGDNPHMLIFAQPVTKDEIHAIQTKNSAEIEAFQDKLFNPEKFAKQAAAKAKADRFKALNDILDRGEQSSKSEAVVETEAAVDTEASVVADAEAALENEATIDAEASAEASAEAEATVDEETLPEDYDENLFTLKLEVQSKVNGKVTPRPSQLGFRDQWTVGYNVTELDVKLGNSLLQGCKKRRRLVLEKNDDNNDPRNKQFLEMLQKVSERGRRHREKMNRKDRAQGIVVYKDMSTKAQEVKKAQEAKQTQEVKETQEVKKTQDVKESQEAEQTQEAQEVKETKETQETKEV